MKLLGVVSAILCAAPAIALTWRGADISSVPIVEAAGITYKDTNGVAGKFENIAYAHGMNTARVRLWTTGQYNTTFGLALGKRIKAAGMTLIVDLHFSDTWADPGHQATPAGWGTTVAALNTNIHDYTKGVVQAFAYQGTPIDILQIGNEINNGLLWPLGETSAGYSAPSQFLHSARQGARDAGFGGKVLIHLADGWSVSEQTTWYQNILAVGPFSLSDFDIMGGSFYPFYGTGATLSALQSSLTTLANTYGKPIIVAETDWPATSCSVALSASFPDSPAGQSQWMTGIINVLKALPKGLGQGFLYWEPGWIGNANLGSGCADNLLVSSTGTMRSSVAMFANV